MVFLEKLLVEADYLDTLSTQVTEELARRDESADQTDTMDVYRSILPPSEVQVFFEHGWAFVSTYEANERKVTATWRNMCCRGAQGQCYHPSFFNPASRQQ